MKPEFSLYKAVFPDVLEFHCCRGEREVGGWAREPARAAPSTADTEPDVQENPAQPRPGQVYTGGKINGHRSAIQRHRGAGRRLPSDRGCAGDTAGVTSLGTALTGDTAGGHIAGDRSAQRGDTARGHLTGSWGAHWRTQLGVTSLGTGCPPWDTPGAQPAARPGHVPKTLAAAAAGAHPRCVGGPWPCPCRDTAVTRSASPQLDGEMACAPRHGLSPAPSCLICFIICTGQQITQLRAF